MKNSDFKTSFSTHKSAQEAFTAINNVRAWWSSSLEGNSEKLDDVFRYKYKALHYSTQKLIEVVPNKKVVWQVSDSTLNFVDKKDEWDNTTIEFEITEKAGKTNVVFTHHGLLPSVECFEACTGGWNHYLHKSLVPLINDGKGNPD
jgi:hypothetical protein